MNSSRSTNVCSSSTYTASATHGTRMKSDTQEARERSHRFPFQPEGRATMTTRFSVIFISIQIQVRNIPDLQQPPGRLVSP